MLPINIDDMIFYIGNPKDVTRKLLELINEFSKVTGHKINTQHFYNNEVSEREIRKQFHLSSQQNEENT